MHSFSLASRAEDDNIDDREVDGAELKYDGHPRKIMGTAELFKRRLFKWWAWFLSALTNIPQTRWYWLGVSFLLGMAFSHFLSWSRFDGNRKRGLHLLLSFQWFVTAATIIDTKQALTMMNSRRKWLGRPLARYNISVVHGFVLWRRLSEGVTHHLFMREPETITLHLAAGQINSS